MATPKLLRTALIAALSWSLSLPAFAQSDIELSPAARIALGIETAPIATATASEGLSAPGVVIAPNGALQATTSPFDGVLVDVLVTPGSKVRTGDEIAVIYSGSFSNANAELEKHRMTAAHKAEIAKRAEKLHELGLRSTQEAEEAQHEAHAARLAYEAMRAQLAFVKAGEQAGQFVLTAPAAGVITQVYPAAGDTISGGAPIASILSGNKFWARAQLSERQTASLKPGDPVGIDRVSAPGKILSVDPQIDPTTRSLSVVVELPPDGGWRLGTMLVLSFQTAPVNGALAAPSRAIVRIDGSEVVFVQTEEGFHVTPIEVVFRSRNSAIIRGDIAPGARVAVSGLAALKNIAGGV